MILAELVSTYHGVAHHCSFASQDCGNKLLAKLCPDSVIASKVSCGRTKAASFVENVLGPKAQEKCIEDLKNIFFFSIGSDASNKSNKKLFPIVVRYFPKPVVFSMLHWTSTMIAMNLRKQSLITKRVL